MSVPSPRPGQVTSGRDVRGWFALAGMMAAPFAIATVFVLVPWVAGLFLAAWSCLLWADWRAGRELRPAPIARPRASDPAGSLRDRGPDG